MDSHPFHEYIGTIIESKKQPMWEILRDYSCGGKGEIPFFREKRSRETWYCNVDVAIIVEKTVRVIIEIEESDIRPNNILGKLLASLLSTHCIIEKENKKYPIENAYFIQIINSNNLDKNSAKREQLDNLEDDINQLISGIDFNIRSYKIFIGAKDDIDVKNIMQYIQNILK